MSQRNHESIEKGILGLIDAKTLEEAIHFCTHGTYYEGSVQYFDKGIVVAVWHNNYSLKVEMYLSQGEICEIDFSAIGRVSSRHIHAIKVILEKLHRIGEWYQAQ